jgi:hypothetical protein
VSRHPARAAYLAALEGEPLSELDAAVHAAPYWRRPAIRLAILLGSIDHLRAAGVPEDDTVLSGLVEATASRGSWEGFSSDPGLVEQAYVAGYKAAFFAAKAAAQ